MDHHAHSHKGVLSKGELKDELDYNTNNHFERVVKIVGMRMSL